MEGLSHAPRAALSQCILSSLTIQFLHWYQGLTHAHSFCVHGLWIQDALQAWSRRKNMLSSSSKRWKTVFRSCLHIGGKRTSSIISTNSLKSALIWKDLSLRYHARMKRRRSKIASTSMGYDVWWPVPSRSGNWCSNPSMLLCARSLTVHLYGKVEGMWAKFCMLFLCSNHLCRVNLRKFRQHYG